MREPGEFRRGWPIVLASLVGIALGLSPIPFYEISLFAPQLAREFGWGLGTIMTGVFFMMCGSLVASPVVGFLADRYGPRRVALTSTVLFGMCLSLFSEQNGSLALYYGNWFAMAFTGAGTLPITWTRAINQAFDAKKGLALGWALAGTGLSGFVLKPATAAVIAAYGWRNAFVFLGSLPILVSLPIAAICFRQPISPDRVGTVQRGPVAGGTSSGRSFREAIGDRRFWLIGLGILPVAFAVSGPIANMDAILRTHGVERGIIRSMVPFIGLAVIIGRLGGGWLVDRVWAPAVAAGLFTLAASASWLLVKGPPTAGCVLAGVLGIGLAAGLEFDLMAFLTARYFGRRSYGGIYGTMYAFFALGSGIAPLIYGRAFDSTGGFGDIVGIGAGSMLTGGLLLLLLGPYRFPREGSSVVATSTTGGLAQVES